MTRSNRPGWSVIFKHPKRSDSRGKPGLKIRKGLRTQDDGEADRLVAQLNTLLADEPWWSTDRRTEAAQQFDPVVLSAFFDGMEAGKHDSLSLREGVILLPPTAKRIAPSVSAAGSRMLGGNWMSPLRARRP